MKFTVGLAFLFTLISLPAWSREFASLQIQGWKKMELSSDHLRFSRESKPGVVIHIQVDSYDPKNHWRSDTLLEDIKKMEKMRNSMSFFMAMKDYKISNTKLNSNLLELDGTYLKMGNKKVQFKEINFYRKDHFLQVKWISDSKLPSEEEMRKTLDQLNLEQVEID